MFTIASAKSLHITVAAAALSLSSVSAFADYSMTIDAAKNCMNTPNNALLYGSVVTANIPAGAYMVYLLNGTMAGCGNGSLTGYCKIDHVIVRANSNTQAAWGLSVGSEPALVHFNLPSTRVDAFVVDEVCVNNTGTGTLYFKGPY